MADAFKSVVMPEVDPKPPNRDGFKWLYFWVLKWAKFKSKKRLSSFSLFRNHWRSISVKVANDKGSWSDAFNAAVSFAFRPGVSSHKSFRSQTGANNLDM